MLLIGETGRGEDVGWSGHMELCVISAQFFCNPNSILKNKIYYSKINRLKAKRVEEITFFGSNYKGNTYAFISYEWYQTK